MTARRAPRLLVQPRELRELELGGTLEPAPPPACWYELRDELRARALVQPPPRPVRWPDERQEAERRLDRWHRRVRAELERELWPKLELPGEAT